MMDALMRRAEALVAAEQRRRVAALVEGMTALLRGASIEVEEGRVILSGRGLTRRWLTEPGLRFLGSRPR